VSFVPKVRLDIAVDNAVAERVVETIRLKGQTGQIGDGKIFVLPLEQAVRIRTGETGPAAL
jgi:nitrogen regulatory protein PII